MSSFKDFVKKTLVALLPPTTRVKHTTITQALITTGKIDRIEHCDDNVAIYFTQTSKHRAYVTLPASRLSEGFKKFLDPSGPLQPERTRIVVEIDMDDKKILDIRIDSVSYLKQE